MTDTIKSLTAEITVWADNHPKLKDRTPESIFMKFFEEIGELIKSPKSPGEHADVAILLFDLADAYGVDLAQAIKDKMVVNRGRDWALTETGTYQHTQTGNVTPIRRPSPPPPSGFGEFQDTPLYESASAFDKFCYNMGGEDARAGRPKVGALLFSEWMNENAGRNADLLQAITTSTTPPNLRDGHDWYKMGYEKARGESHD